MLVVVFLGPPGSWLYYQAWKHAPRGHFGHYWRMPCMVEIPCRCPDEWIEYDYARTHPDCRWMAMCRVL